MHTGRPGRVDWSWNRRQTILIVAALLIVDGLIGLALVRVGFWPFVSGIVALAATAFLLSSPRALVLTVFVVKPLIDMLWFAGADVVGVSLNAASVLTVLIVIACMLLIAARRAEVSRDLKFGMLAVTLANLWALVITPNLAYGAEFLIRVLCGFPLFLIVPSLVQRLPPPKRLLQMFFVVMAFVCVTVLLQPLGLLPYTSFEDNGLGRATGFYYHPWDVARYMVILVPLLLAVIDRPGRHRLARDWPYWIILTAALVTTAFTFLKAAWIAVFVQILLWLAFTRRRVLALLLLALTIVLVVFPLREGFVSVFSDLWKLGDEATRGQALSGRIFLWEEYWNGLRNAGIPEILFGQGYLPSGGAATRINVHGDYLRVLVMNGAVGLLAYLGLIVATFRLLSRAVKQLAKRGGIEWRIGIAVECLLAAYLLMGITADPSSYPSLTLYLWLLVGLVVGYSRLNDARVDT